MRPDPAPLPERGGMLEARCGRCRMTWVVAHLPMPFATARRLAAAAQCPHGCIAKVLVA